MSEILDNLNRAMDKVQELGGRAVDGVKDALDKTDIDEKIIGAAKDLRDRAKEALDKTDIDEKLVDAAKGIKDKAQALLDKTDLDEKIVDAAKDLKDKAAGLVNRPDAPADTDAAQDIMRQIKDDVAAQVENIRAAASASNPIHDYFQGKKGE